ncbi:MAG: NYN domain-containing protein [Nanoarchaeota archaeon]|nr:NYN domain-containing protein [Nanoarchaeota archaeon]
MKKERVVVFIDGSNLYYSLKNLKKGRIDFQNLLRLVTKNKMLISTFYYNAPLNIKVNPKTYWEQQKFLTN